MNPNIKKLAEAKAKKGSGDKEPSPRHFLTSTRERDTHGPSLDYNAQDYYKGKKTPLNNGASSAYYTKGRFQESGEGSPIIEREYRNQAQYLDKKYESFAPVSQRVVRVRDKSPMYRNRH